MYVVKKAGKCLTEKVSFPRHSWQASHCSVNTALEAFSAILQKVLECLQKENRKKRKCFVFLTKIFLQLVFTHTELRIILISSKSRKNTSRAVVVKVFVMFCFVPGGHIITISGLISIEATHACLWSSPWRP